MAYTSGVYVLELNEEGFYYVGQSTNIEKRIQQHIDGKGSAFCKAHGGVKRALLPFTKRRSRLTMWEQAETVHRMIRYGVNKVRGWEYTSCGPLSAADAYSLRQLVMGTYNLCRKCGRQGHFAKGCKRTAVKWLRTLDSIVNGQEI